MENVVELKPPAPRVWICGCGSASFLLLDDGTAECSMCGYEPSVALGGWKDIDRDKRSDVDAPTVDIHGNGSLEFVRAYIVKKAGEDDVLAVSVCHEGGEINTWSSAETPDQIDWVGRKLRECIDIIAEGASARKGG